jgi:hypothetical protein
MFVFVLCGLHMAGFGVKLLKDSHRLRVPCHITHLRNLTRSLCDPSTPTFTDSQHNQTHYRSPCKEAWEDHNPCHLVRRLKSGSFLIGQTIMPLVARLANASKHNCAAARRILLHHHHVSHKEPDASALPHPSNAICLLVYSSSLSPLWRHATSLEGCTRR